MGPRQAERSQPQPGICSLSVAERDHGARAAESEEPLQGRANSDGQQDTGGEPEPRCNCTRRTVALTVTLAIVSSAFIIATVLAVQGCKLLSADLCAPAEICCPDDWIGYRGKCYYFSETEGNWNYSLTNCSALSASLAGIDSEQDMVFLQRYKGKFDHWIGLRRNPGQPWKWANGTEFNNLFVVRGGGDCGYLNDENGVSSSRCTNERYWICTKPDAFT
ncbi:C-type lectin domain family 2 member B-like [Trachemys scripta elegans]|uniref:C-type lectin domain family 2 member B-like n=1 Tax=Trachemys scripta elegans TaxID=31138 RepID=UPI0015519CE2|nr:C-type lectin domain family 2 member B-like [Trachemys scripta elegans]